MNMTKQMHYDPNENHGQGAMDTYAARYTVYFSLPKASLTTFKVFDEKGREAITVFRKHMPPGRHSAVLDVTDLPRGVYIYRIRAEGFEQTRKLKLG